MYRTSVLILHQHITLHNHLFSIFEISPKAKQAIIHSLKKILKLGKKFYTQAYECMVNNFFFNQQGTLQNVLYYWHSNHDALTLCNIRFMDMPAKQL